MPSNGDATAVSRGIKGNLVRIQSSTRYCKFHYRKSRKTTAARGGKVHFREQVRKPATRCKITLSTGLWARHILFTLFTKALGFQGNSWSIMPRPNGLYYISLFKIGQGEVVRFFPAFCFQSCPDSTSLTTLSVSRSTPSGSYSFMSEAPNVQAKAW